MEPPLKNATLLKITFTKKLPQVDGAVAANKGGPRFFFYT